ncbi:ATP synthase subunit I [Glaciecola sp. SC05]|uniref:N-ATPase subunit AtpR n=1 Tax=Glaciecola sp. SC05 TaxID=1987355 RepID=UPI0035295923
MTKMLILSLLFGAALGAVFFLGLWWSVHRGLNSKNPAVWFFISFFVRVSMALAGFYWIATSGQWQQMMLALFGFALTRFILTRWLLSDTDSPAKSSKHAS